MALKPLNISNNISFQFTVSELSLYFKYTFVLKYFKEYKEICFKSKDTLVFMGELRVF